MNINEFFDKQPVDLLYADDTIFELINKNGDIVTVRVFKGLLHYSIVEEDEEDEDIDLT
jgi:hypothetical protein